MARAVRLVTPLLLSVVACQSLDNTTEVHPKLTTYKCTTDGGCVSQNTALVLESSQHNIYQLNNPEYNCGEWGSAANATICPDQETCQKNCIMEGISDYTTRGVYTNGSDLTLFMLSANGTEYSPRVYLLNEAEDAYELLHLTGQEFTFDVDMSKLPCGMNSALYFSEMEATGGKDLSNIPVAGAPYGTGYCDAQCYTTPFVNGLVSTSFCLLAIKPFERLQRFLSIQTQANTNGSGICCAELDIWEANSRATQFAPHTCNQTGLYMCDPQSGECGASGVCDKNGCSMNPYKMGHPEYYGLNMLVDTSRPFSVVTQFPAANGSGLELTSYKRLYIQDGTVIEMPTVNINGVEQNTMGDDYCTAQGASKYMDLGATKGMGESMSRGMVLIFSLWWDSSSFMQWLDQTSSGSGPCNATEGNPAVIEAIQPDTQVTFSQIRWGDIGSTFSSG